MIDTEEEFDIPRLDSIVRERLRWDEDLDEVQIARQFKYETGREPDGADVSRAIQRAIKRAVKEW